MDSLDLAAKYYEAWNTYDVSIPDEIFSPDFSIADPTSPVPVHAGPEGVKDRIDDYHRAFDELTIEPTLAIASGDYATTHWILRGRHRGEFAGIPASGNDVEAAGITIHRCAGGRIVEAWVVWDTRSLLDQMRTAPASVRRDDRPWGLDGLSRAELDEGIERIRRSPTAVGALEMIVARPGEDDRVVLEKAALDVARGLVGDDWASRPSYYTGYDRPSLEAQITIMNVAVLQLLCRDRARWASAGDQLYVDFDLSKDGLPPGSRLRVGDALLEITPEPHLGCGKFVERFGRDAMAILKTDEGRARRYRGVKARVIRSGTVRVGDAVEQEART